MLEPLKKQIKEKYEKKKNEIKINCISNLYQMYVIYSYVFAWIQLAREALLAV